MRRFELLKEFYPDLGTNAFFSASSRVDDVLEARTTIQQWLADLPPSVSPQALLLQISMEQEFDPDAAIMVEMITQAWKANVAEQNALQALKSITAALATELEAVGKGEKEAVDSQALFNQVNNIVLAIPTLRENNAKAIDAAAIQILTDAARMKQAA